MNQKLKQNKIFRLLIYKYRDIKSRFSYKHGKLNYIYNEGIKISTKIQIQGLNNMIRIEDGCILKHAKIYINGNDNSIIIHKSAYLENTELYIEDNNCHLEIGEKTFLGLSHLAVTENDSRMIIGSDCMISSHVQIRTGDSHSILTIYGERINKAKSVYIGNHVWIGEGAKILKGVSLAQDVIVSSGAIVTKSFEQGQLIGGIPARVLKTNVSWDKMRI